MIKIKITAVIFTVILFCSVAIASTVKTAPIAKAEDLFSAVSVYCNKWQELIGDDMGCDMSFNADNINKIQKKHYDLGGNLVTTFNFDGIEAEIDDEMNVYNIQIPFLEMYASTARIFAVINALAYDYPANKEEMINRYTEFLNQFTEFMGQNEIVLASEKFAYWTINTDNVTIEIPFLSVNGTVRMMYDNITFED